MSKIGTPLTNETLGMMGEEEQLLYKAFFKEAKKLLDKQTDKSPITPSTLLQNQYEGSVAAQGGHFCPVRQIVSRFAFKAPESLATR